MSRRAHPKNLVAMRRNGYTYREIAKALVVGESTIRDWVTYRTRIA